MTAVSEAFSVTLGIEKPWLLCRRICLLSGSLCPAQMVSGVLSVASLIYSLEQGNVITHSMCATPARVPQGTGSKAVKLAGKYCLRHYEVGWERGCWEIDVCSEPCTERDGHPAVTPSSLLPDKCSGLFEEALSEHV